MNSILKIDDLKKVNFEKIDINKYQQNDLKPSSVFILIFETIKGKEILFFPTAIGWHPKERKKFGNSQLDAWITIQRSHAIANGVFVAAINRIGLEKVKNKKIQFWGNSMIIDPSGNIIKQSKSNKEEILICDIDFRKVENTRQHWPFLRDRRIDYYKGLLKNPEDA